MMAHQSKSKSRKPPRSYLPPEQNRGLQKNRSGLYGTPSLRSLHGGSDFQLISPISDLSNPSFSAFHHRSQGNVEEVHRRSQGNVDEEDLTPPNRHVLVIENIPHPDRISNQRKHILPNDAADINKKTKSKAKLIMEAFKGCVDGGAHRLDKMPEQTTKADRYTWSAVVNAVSNRIHIKKDTKKEEEEDTLNVVVETRCEENAPRTDEKNNTLGLLTNTKDSFFEELWRESKRPQRDLETSTPVVALDKAFEDAYGLHREDDYFDRIAASGGGSPSAKPSFSLLLTDLSLRDTSVAIPPVMQESFMSVYMEEPTEKAIKLTDSTLKKHDENTDSSFHVTNDKIEYAQETKPRASSSADKLIYSPEDVVEASLMFRCTEEPSQDNKNDLSMVDSTMDQFLYQYSFHPSLVQSESPVTNISASDGSPCTKSSFSLMLTESSTSDTSVAIPPAVDESLISVYIEGPTMEGIEPTDNALKKYDESIDSSFHVSNNKTEYAPETKPRTSFNDNNLIYSPDGVMDQSIMSCYIEEPSQDKKDAASKKDASIDQETTTETPSAEHQDKMVPLESTRSESSDSQQELEEFVSVVSDTINESPATELSERNVSKLSLESEHRESFQNVSTVSSDIMSRTPTAALHDHQDRRVSATVSPSSPHKSENRRLVSMEKTSRELMPEFLEEVEDAEASPLRPNDFVRDMETSKYKPIDSDGPFRKADLASRSMDDGESFSSEFMSLKVTESAPSVLETTDFKTAVHTSPEIIKNCQRKPTIGLVTPSMDYKKTATGTSDRSGEAGIVGCNLEASFLAPIPYSPSDDSVASSTGSPIPVVSNQALSNAAFLLSPSFAGEEIKLLTRASSPIMMNLSTFAINTAQSRSRLCTFSARSRPAFSIPISSVPDDMSSIRPSRCSYDNDDFTYSRRESHRSNEGSQKHVHFSNANECFVIREANKARVAMGTPLKIDSPVIEKVLSDLSDTGMPFATSTANDPGPSLLWGSCTDSSLRTNEQDNAQEVKAGDGDLDLFEKEARKDGSVNGDVDRLQDGEKGSSVVESTAQDTSKWTYREENGVHCAATPLRANGRSVQKRPGCVAPANSPMIRFREAKRKFSSKPVAKVPTRKPSPMKFAKPNNGGTVRSRVTELNGRLKSNRQLVQTSSRRDTGGQNVIAPRPAKLVAPLFRNPVMMSNRDGDTIQPKNNVDSQVIYEGRFDSGISTVASCESESERKAKYGIETQSMCDRISDTGVSTVASSECEAKSNIDISTIISDADKDIFRKMIGSPQELSSESEDEDDAFAEVMNSSPLFDDHKLGRTSGTSLQSLLSQDENKSRNQQPPRPRLSDGPIGTSLRSIISEDPSALTFESNKENSSLGPRTLSFTDKAKVNPREQQQHHAHPGALCLSPLQRTPMQARKWRTLAAAAKEKDCSKKGSSKKGSSKKKLLGPRERNSNEIY